MPDGFMCGNRELTSVFITMAIMVTWQGYILTLPGLYEAVTHIRQQIVPVESAAIQRSQ
jgi:hypothetical protein